MQIFFIKCRGIVTGQFIKRLNLIRGTVQPVITLCKMRTCLPSLKSKIEKNLKIQVVYKFVCPGCNTYYDKYCNLFHNILRLLDDFPNFSFTTSETMRDYYL